MYDEHWALEKAVEAGCKAQCMKSKRGVVIWVRETGDYVLGFNSPPDPFECTGRGVGPNFAKSCFGNCNKVAVHAEQAAIINAGKKGLFTLAGIIFSPLEMLHVKVVDGKAIASGEPSCWQCSRLILDAGIKDMWLLHEDGLKKYSAYDFHKQTLENCNLV
jgi:deoxycytidylate deaminase